MNRTLPAAVVILTAILAFATDDALPPVPPDPKVPAKVDLPPKDFTEAVEETLQVPDPKNLDTPILRKTKLTFEMVYIKGGEFTMGSPENEVGRVANEGPQHQMKVRPFWLAKFETTWDQFDLWFLSANLPKRDYAEGEYESKNPGTKLRRDAITRPTNPYVDETYEHGREGKPAICMTTMRP